MIFRMSIFMWYSYPGFISLVELISCFDLQVAQERVESGVSVEMSKPPSPEPQEFLSSSSSRPRLAFSLYLISLMW